jgi:NADH-quinone oxidoreductase subunit G
MAEQEQNSVDDGNVSLSIDGRELRVPKGTLVLDAATEAGVHIPIYCAHPKMDPVAVCRMCLVHVEKMPKLQPACATTCSDGMVVTTQRPDVAKAREGVLEFLLLNHPLDCPVCDRGGECDLQDFAFRYGPQSSRFPITDKSHAEKAKVLSEKIELDQERCILCWRCTRYYDEITGEKELVLNERGVKTAIDTFDGSQLKSEFQGNLPEVCPVGALTHRQYRFKARPWDLQRTKSVCPECSYGCNINIDSRNYEVVRFASRDNPLVDDMWLCDRGRYSATSWNDVQRVRRPRIAARGEKGQDVTLEAAVQAAAGQLKAVIDKHGGKAVAVLGSSGHTNEELWTLQRFARDIVGTPNLDHTLEVVVEPTADDHELGIAQIEECSHVFVVGDKPEIEAPVLKLRLHKAETKCGVKVHRIDEKSKVPLLTNAGLVGIISDQANVEQARALADSVTGAGRVARLTITRGVNGRGANDIGMTPTLLPGYKSAPSKGISGAKVAEAVAKGEIRALVVMGGASLFEGADDEMAKAIAGSECVVAIETTPSVVSENATALFPGHTYFEKAGTVTNVEGRVQRIRAALPPSTSLPGEIQILQLLADAMGAKEWSRGDAIAIHKEMVKAIPQYEQAGNGGRASFVRVTA